MKVTVRDAQRFVASDHYWSRPYQELSADLDTALRKVVGVLSRGRIGKDEVLQALASYSAQYGNDTILLDSEED